MDNTVFKFSDRAQAGVLLAERLSKMGLDRPLVYALPRGGVPVAVEVARKLNAPLDLILVRKIGAPGNPEVALGAIVEGANVEVVINEDIRRISGADTDYLERTYSEQLAELERRKVQYLGDRPRLNPAGRTVVVVDDGLATGATMKAALIALKRNKAARIVIALPVAPKEELEALADQADDIVCLHPATEFRGVGGFFHDFHQLSDEETITLLDQHWSVQDTETPLSETGTLDTRRVEIPPLGLVGDLVVPENPRGIIIVAHGSGSSRHSPCNTFEASKLNEKGFATLLLDLLTPAEGRDRQHVLDIPLLAERVVEACMWIGSEPDIADLPLGIFEASTDAGVALMAANELKRRIAAVVSCGGRADLAGALPDVSGEP